MRVLLIKTSSLGDIIHALPALTDAARAIPGIRFDWVVEESFVEIPTWHPAVDRVIPVAIRRWRKNILRTWFGGEWRRFTGTLVQNRYDATIDAQGLLKSAFLTRYATVPVHGFDRDSAREPLASRFYTDRHAVVRDRHAVERLRELFARALDYPVPDTPGEYGLDRRRILAASRSATTTADSQTDTTDHIRPREHEEERDYLVFLHATTWPTKHWPEDYWRALIHHAGQAGWRVRLPWGNDDEHARALRLAESHPHVIVLPRLSLSGIARQLAGARACVAVDTGLGHLAAALDVPTVSLFGPTHPGYTGAWGWGQIHLASDLDCAPCLGRRCAKAPQPTPSAWPPCFERVTPATVWAALEPALTTASTVSPRGAYRPQFQHQGEPG